MQGRQGKAMQGWQGKARTARQGKDGTAPIMQMRICVKRAVNDTCDLNQGYTKKTEEHLLPETNTNSCQKRKANITARNNHAQAI